MVHVLKDEEALEAYNKLLKTNLSKSEQDELNKIIQQIASQLQLVAEKCDLNTLPDFVQQSNSRLYSYEIEKAAASSARQKIATKPHNFFKEIHKLTAENGSSFYLMAGGFGYRIVSSHWTKESIDKCAALVAKLGGDWKMLPLGEPGAFPAHLRAYATQAYAKHGIHLPDPTPPTAEDIERSRKQYEASDSSKSKPSQKAMKQELATLRQQTPKELDSSQDNTQSNETRIPPFSIVPKPRYTPSH
ncbi:hypothetical protein [Legionella hackeliae]|uniref:Uncharacterized protein n=1 Tax=Legionella hackeliae TaxID=449 RepID=A0A0A8UW67_LEGHA|nr:hypothetical protein [Legionella hackeliae]KTD15295.1 hypothetical protein Lhac_0137 [Legionella hackeliae]CEK11337.1 protein of unknown function [Legionella hackeliae]STX48109.1 Uncharacterised protein [Legionella hackeliae]